MADKLEFEHYTYNNVSNLSTFFKVFPHMRVLIDDYKKPIVMHIDAECDTLSTTLTDIAKPTKVVNNFTTAKEVFIKSDNALDISKSLTIIGQKADESFGKFEFETDDTDGTTPVSTGEWLCIFTTIGIDTAVGNITVYNGSDTYFTLALGATPYKGIVYVPKGYKACVVSSTAHLISTPSNTSAGVAYYLGEDFGCLLSLGNGHVDKGDYGHIYEETTQIRFQGEYKTAMTKSILHSYIAFIKE